MTKAQTKLNTNPNNHRDTLSTSTAAKIDNTIAITVFIFFIFTSFNNNQKKQQPNKVNYSAVSSIYFKINKLF